MIKAATSVGNALAKPISISVSVSNENALMNEILTTRASDSRDIRFHPVLQVISDIFNLATPNVDAIANGVKVELDGSKDKMNQANLEGALSTHAQILNKISCEDGFGEKRKKNMILLSIFKLLSGYSWESIGVFILAALAVNYGEIWLIAQLSKTNQLAQSVSLLKHLSPGLTEQSNKVKFEGLNTLITTIKAVVELIIQFKELHTQHILLEVPAMTEALAKVPNAIYWTVRSAVSCAIMISSLIGYNPDQQILSVADAPEISVVTNKIKDILSYLKSSYTLCVHFIDQYMAEMNSYEKLVQTIESSLDQITILSAFINNTKDNIAPLFDGSTRKKVQIEDLKGKNIFFLISDLDFQNEELEILCDIYAKEKKDDSQYEIIWLPMVDVSIHWDEATLKIYEQLRLKMKWLSIDNPSLIKPSVIKYIKEKWQFVKMTILVALDKQGKVVHQNAIHMVQVLGGFEFAFKPPKEIESHWSGITWNLEWLVQGIYDDILDWAKEKKYICLYGGEDIKWVKEFIEQAKKIATLAGITLDMVYMGTSNTSGHGDQIIKTLPKDQTHTLRDHKSTWLFWSRLESLLRLKIKSGKTVKDDLLMREVLMTLTYDGSGKGWAVIGGGLETNLLVKARGDVILECFAKFDQWKEKGSQEGRFLQAINEWLSKVHSEKKHCHKLTFPMIDGHVLDIVECPDCGHPMEKFVMYKCCIID
ncbi:Sieve element occlusion, C-terminal [Dillenia turbinata]|uniref:Sieve element occlusion, C-terminal n=1 Tax=Dillenia turbinata TaxID=194707 RepID=A0AAN8Z8Q2_9MAGN